MAKKIALQLEIGGVKQSISSINDLETAITDANKQLKGLEIGSTEFQKLQGEIKKAKNLSEDLSESLKGQDLEKRVGAYAKVGSAIVGSFAAAQSAIALFGEESEDVARAAAKAQAVLTIALTAREVAEGAVALKTVAANIATVASAAAANAATVATRTLYATIAANPFGALLVAIGAVVGALIAFSGESEKQVDILKDVNASVSEEAFQFGRQIVLLQSLNTANALRTKTIEDLNKAYPGFNAFLSEENTLTQEGIRFTELRLKQLQEEAKIKLLVSKIAEQSVKILELEQENIIDNITIWDELWASIRGVGRVTPVSALTLAIEEKNKKVEEARKQLKILQGALDQTTKEYGNTLDAIGPYTKKLDEQNKLNEKIAKSNENAARTQQQISEAYKKGLTATIDLSNAIKSLNESLVKYEQTLETLSNIDYQAPILEQLKKVKEARSSAAQELVRDVDRVKQTLKTFEIPQEAKIDPLINIFKVIREELEAEFGRIGTSAFKGFTDIYKRFVEDNATLSQKQKNILADVIQGYQDLGTLLTDPKYGFQDFINGLKDIGVEWDNFRSKLGEDPKYGGADALAMIIGEITAANRAYTVEFAKTGGALEKYAEMVSDSVNKIEEIQFDPVRAKENANKYIKELENSLFKPLAIRLLQEELKAQQTALSLTQDVVKRGEIEGYIKNIATQIEVVTKTGQFAANLTQTTGEQVTKQVQTLSAKFLQLATAVVTAEQKIILVNQEFNKLKESLKPEELSQAIGGTILANIDFISKLLLGARTKEQKIEKDFIEKLKNDRKGLENFKAELIKAGVDVEKASYEDLLAAYIEYKKKEKEVDQQSNKDKKQNSTQALNDIQKGIQVFQGYLSEAASLVNTRIQTDIQSLTIAEQQLLDNVVGDTETAAQKRLEIQAEYEARRKELEKKARISSLQFSLVQAVANAAQGITRTIAEFGFPIAAPLIAIQAGLTAAELAIISDQISNAQSMRRGGVVKAQGGMLLSGPSHENGGIPLAQMGVIAEGQEAIINRNSLINYRDLLSTINQAGGGRPLVVNNFDDTRIVEAIASQRQKPLRAYVLQSEITNEQALSKRLDDLSKI